MSLDIETYVIVLVRSWSGHSESMTEPPNLSSSFKRDLFYHASALEENIKTVIFETLNNKKSFCISYRLTAYWYEVQIKTLLHPCYDGWFAVMWFCDFLKDKLRFSWFLCWLIKKWRFRRQEIISWKVIRPRYIIEEKNLNLGLGAANSLEALSCRNGNVSFVICYWRIHILCIEFEYLGRIWCDLPSVKTGDGVWEVHALWSVGTDWLWRVTDWVPLRGLTLV